MSSGSRGAGENARGGSAIACGALGAHEHSRLDAMAARAGVALGPALVQDRAALLMDHRPCRWGHGERTGYCWPESVRPCPTGARSWKDAAELGACGLARNGDDWLLHSSAPGLGTLYYATAAGAVYFATTIDILLGALDPPLHPDWEAWAGILSVKSPVGERTPFAEVRGLPPNAALTEDRGRANVREAPWTWIETAPEINLAEGAIGLLEAMRAAVAELPAGRIACPLTGGLDSRLLACLLAERPDVEPFAVTTSSEDGTWLEERTAAAVANELGMEHVVVEGEPGAYVADLREYARRIEFQFASRPWPMPLLAPLRGDGAVVVDGTPLDVLLHSPGRYIPPEAVLAETPAEAAIALWGRLKKRMHNPRTSPLRPATARELWAASREHYVALAEAIGPAGSLPPALLYRARTIRGTALNPVAVLGREVPVSLPYADMRVVEACLRIKPPEPIAEVALHDRLVRELAPGAAAIPGANAILERTPKSDRTRPQRQFAPETAADYRELLLDSPVKPLVRAKARRGLREGRAPRALEGLALLALWHERYADLLRDFDPVSGFGLADEPGDESERV